MSSTTDAVEHLLALFGVDEPPERYAALLRPHRQSPGPRSQHAAALTRQRVQERAPPASREQFGALYDELRGRGVREVDGVAQLLQRVGEERAVERMLADHATAAAAAAAGARSPRRAAAAPSSGTPSERSGVSASTSVAAASARSAAAASVASAAAAAPPPPSELSWLHTRPYLSSTHLHGGMIGGRAWAGAEADRGSVRTASGALVALPVGEQEDARHCLIRSVQAHGAVHKQLHATPQA